MNTDKAYLKRRIEIIQGILDNPSQLDVPHPKGYSKPAYSISEGEIEYLKLDNVISGSILNRQDTPNKLLFNPHQFPKSKSLLTNFEYNGCCVDYSFVCCNDGLQLPYAIGLELDEPFNGWYHLNTKIDEAIPYDNCLALIPLFFVTPNHIFLQEYGRNADYPNAENAETLEGFKLWLKEMKDRESKRDNFTYYNNEQPLKKHLSTFI